MAQLISKKELSEMIGLKEATISKYICEKKIPNIKLGSRVLFSVADIEKWVKSKAVSVIGNKAGAR